MPSSGATFDLASHWQPVAHSLAGIRGQVGHVADCADSVLAEVESIRQELLARANELERLQQQLAEREEHLAQQRTEHTRLCSQFEQQEARLSETMEELRRLREELANRATPESLAADSAREALEQAREVWQRERSELMERLNALSLMQQTGSGDSDAVKAFCHELTEIHELINSSHNQTREAIDREGKELHERLTRLLENSGQGATNGAAFEEVQRSLGELREQLAKLQTEASSQASQEKDELLRRLDSLAQVRQDAADDAPLLAAIQKELGEMRRLVESVQGTPAAAAPPELITELRADLAEVKRIAAQNPSGGVGEEGLAAFRNELEAMRRQAEEVSKQETERALVEAELDRLRTQAAQWRRELEEETARHHEEERLWREELQELRQLVRQAAAAMSEAPGQLVEAAVSDKGAEASDSDPVANSLMAQFAKLQKDSARRRNRGNNS